MSGKITKLFLFISTLFLFSSCDSKVYIGSNVEVLPDHVHHNLYVLWGNLKFEGHAQNIYVLGGTTIIESTAVVTEDVIVVGSELEIAPEAEISGRILNPTLGLDIRTIHFFFETVWPWLQEYEFKDIFKFILLGTIGLFQLIITLIFPQKVSAVFGKNLQNPVSDYLFGFISLFILFTIQAVCLITVFGIILLPFLYSFIFAIFLLTSTQASMYLGHLAKDFFKKMPNFIQWFLGFSIQFILLMWIPYAFWFVLVYQLWFWGHYFRTWRKINNNNIRYQPVSVR